MATGMSVVFSRVGAETANLVCFSADHPVIQTTDTPTRSTQRPPIKPRESVRNSRSGADYSIVQFYIPSTAQKNRIGASTGKYI